MLYIKSKFYYISVLHDVGFAFGAEFAGGFDGLFGAELFQIVIITDLSGDEDTLEIGVDGAGGFWGSGAFFDSPGTAFFLAGGQEGLKPKCLVGGFNELAEGVFFDAVAL